MKYFYSSIIISILALFLSYFIGGMKAVYICSLLAIFEVSLSFDNSIVNAKTLKDMSKKWQDRFIVFGIPLAVFIMRFLFPIIIVSVAAHMSLFETFMIALKKPKTYNEILQHHEGEIYIFGGSFLLMVFCEFFFSKKREQMWVKILENNILVRTLKNIPSISIIISALVGLGVAYITQNLVYIIAYFGALLVYIILSSFDKIFDSKSIKTGLSGFLYLEVLDASFSFDGVIGAFALSNNIFIIMIGLGIGALFVRSMTIFLARKNVLEKFIYLEHGAHYAILCLAIIMFIKVSSAVSEILTGIIGFVIILISFIFSIIEKRKFDKRFIEAKMQSSD